MKKSTVIILILLVIALAVVPLIIKKGAEFGGSDDQAEGVITQVDPNYHPWASPIYEPASGEIESALFALQAALGAGVIGYYFGRRKSNNENKKK